MPSLGVSDAARKCAGLAPRTATLRNLVQLKRQWIVSVAALAYRLHALGLLTDWHYRTLCIEMGRMAIEGRSRKALSASGPIFWRRSLRP